MRDRRRWRMGWCRTARPEDRRFDRSWRGHRRRITVLRRAILRRTEPAIGLARLDHVRRRNGLASRPAIDGRRDKRSRSGFYSSAFLAEGWRFRRPRLLTEDRVFLVHYLGPLARLRTILRLPARLGLNGYRPSVALRTECFKRIWGGSDRGAHVARLWTVGWRH